MEKHFAVFMQHGNEPIPHSYIDRRLQDNLLNHIGGLRQFYNRPVLMKFQYSKKIELDIMQTTEHKLTLEVCEVTYDQNVRIALPPIPTISTIKPTRWERFKQFVKGE